MLENIINEMLQDEMFKDMTIEELEEIIAYALDNEED